MLAPPPIPHVNPQVVEYLRQTFPQRFEQLAVISRTPPPYARAYTQLMYVRLIASTMRDLHIGGGHRQQHEAFIVYEGGHLTITYRDVVLAFDGVLATYDTWRSRLGSIYATFLWMRQNQHRWGMDGEPDHPHRQLYDALTVFFGQQPLPHLGQVPETAPPSPSRYRTMTMEERAQWRTQEIARRRAVERAHSWNVAHLRRAISEFISAMNISECDELTPVSIPLD